MLMFVAALLAGSALDRAIADLNAGRLAEAEAALRAIVASEQPPTAEAHLQLGIALFRRGRPQEAVGPLTRATQLDSKHAGAWKVLGVAYAAQSLYDLADEPFQTACRLDPREIDACYYYGRNLYALNRFEPSIEALKKALSIETRPARVHAGLAQAYEALGQIEAARLNFTSAIDANEKAPKGNKLRPDDDPRISYSVFLFRQGKLDEAHTWVSQAASDHPSSAKARLQLARVLYQSGKLASAAKQLEETIKLDPRSSTAHLLLGKAYGQLGRPEDAKRHLATAEQLGLQ